MQLLTEQLFRPFGSHQTWKVETVALSAVVLLLIVKSISDKVAKRSCTGFLNRSFRQM